MNMKFERPKSSIKDVAGASPELKAEVLKDRAKIFDKQVFESLKGREREKTGEDLEMISIANEATNALLRKFGLDDFDIPAKNIHIIPEDRWIRGKNSLGAYSALLQGIIIQDTQISKLHDLANVIHEMIHFKAYNALQIKVAAGSEKSKNPEEKPTLSDYRGGFVIKSRDGARMYFTELNEAITEELNKRILKSMLGALSVHPIFKDEMERTQKIVNRYPGALSKSGKPLFTGDTVHAEVEITGAPAEENEPESGEPKVKINTKTLTYKKQRRMLNSLIDKVWKSHKEEFKDKDEVFDVFAKAYVTGNMLPVGRLIEDTFGKGSFRKIGELDMGTKAPKAEKKQS